MRKWLCAMMALALLCGAALAEGDMSQVASAADMTDVIDVVEPDMTPVTAEALYDGVYEVAVESSSSMFKIVGCELVVQDGQMTAILHMKSDSYSHMYAGTAEEAAAAPLESLCALEVISAIGEDGAEGDAYAFVLPVDALDAAIPCAAFSVKKQLWYPRTLLFRADSLPEDAWRAETRVTAESLGLADGAYLADVSIEGGRAKLLSPAVLTVEDGCCLATLVFGTTKIDYVLMDGEIYMPEEADEGVAFTVPVAAFDRGLSIIVDSTAIQPATEVAYTITFDAASLVAQGE